MSIIRAPRPDRDFTIIRNDIIRDARLSMKARGLLIYILSFPDGYQTSSESLVQAGPEGRSAILSGLAELRSAGYLHDEVSRDSRGRIASRMKVYDSPTSTPESASLDTKTEDSPASGFPTSDNRRSKEVLSTRKLTTSEPYGSAAAMPEPPISVPEPVNQRANRLARIYAEAQPMCRFPAISGIVKRAISAGKTDDEIGGALKRIAAEGRTLTVETLRIEIEGFPSGKSVYRESATDKRISENAARIKGFLDSNEEISYPRLEIIN